MSRKCVCEVQQDDCKYCNSLTAHEYQWCAATGSKPVKKGREVYEATPDTKRLISSETKPTSKQEAQGVDPKAALGAAKRGVQYVPPAAIIAIDEALAEGRIKYGVAKWRETKTEYMTYVGGALRHLYAFIDGEDIDPDSIVGKRHLAGALASLAILVDVIDQGTGVDNRPPKGPAGKLLGGKK